MSDNSIKHKLIKDFIPILVCMTVTGAFLTANMPNGWSALKREPFLRLMLGILMLITALASYHYLKFYLNYRKKRSYYQDERFDILRENGFKLCESYVGNKDCFFYFLGNYQGYTFQIYTLYAFGNNEFGTSIPDEVYYTIFYAFTDNFADEMEDYDKEIAMRKCYPRCSLGYHQLSLISSIDFHEDLQINLDKLISIVKSEQLYPLSYEEALKLNGISKKSIWQA